MLRIRPATTLDCHELAPRLRQADLDEIRAGSNSTPLWVLWTGLEQSIQCWTLANTRGDAVGMLGVTDSSGLDRDIYGVWYLGTELPNGSWPYFLKLSRAMLDMLLDEFGSLGNRVWNGNTKHIRWLEWLGAKVGPPDQSAFRTFILEAPNV